MSRHATALPEPTGGGPPDAVTEPEPPADPPGAPRNEVVLVGRLAAEVEERTLPSGDVLATWRLVVGRPPARPRRDGGRPVTVDTLDCVAWTGRLRQSARRLRPGDVVQVEGALRRRFWRAGAGAASRCEVEVTALRRLVRAEQPG